jgi:uncharacterized protein (DUF427 family)
MNLVRSLSTPLPELAAGREDGGMETDVVRTEPWTRRVRAYFGGIAVADSTNVRLLMEQRHLPVYYFPEIDVRTDLLVPTDKKTTCPHKGEASYWSLKVGDRESRDAVWSYPKPIEGRDDIAGYMAFYWDRVDAWFEEDDEVFVHPRDPYHRVDVLRSSRHVRVEIDGETVADSTRPRLLFETSLPTRYYLPRLDVRADLLEPSEKHTQCPYKGVASYWTVTVGGKRHEDIAWSYPFPIPECPKIEGMVSFYNEKVDIYVDGERQPRPNTKWS